MSLAPAGHVWPPSGWHYRRSLASRVIVLTTMAVGFAVALLALGAFLTVRLQMQASLDESLLNRARQAAKTDVLAYAANNRIPSWALGAADIRIFYITTEAVITVDEGPDMTLGQPEFEVANGHRDDSVSSGSVSCGTTRRSRARSRASSSCSANGLVR
jgi:two-component system sensor histidine kinase MprB